MNEIDDLEVETISALNEIAGALRNSLVALGYVERRNSIEDIPGPSEWTKNGMRLEVDGEPASVTALIYRCDVAVGRILLRGTVAPPIARLLSDAIAQCPDLFASKTHSWRRLQAMIEVQTARRAE